MFLAPQKPKDDGNFSSQWSIASKNHCPDLVSWNPPGPTGATLFNPANWKFQQPQHQTYQQSSMGCPSWGESQWSVNNSTRTNLSTNPIAQHGSIGWDEPPLEVVGGLGGGNVVNIKQISQNKMVLSDSISNSKQYRVLLDMGCCKEDAEFALQTTGGKLEDAIELLSINGRMPYQRNLFGRQNSSNLFDQSRLILPMYGRQNLNSQDGRQLGNYNQQQQQQQTQSSQPSPQQLRNLVQQIQMAVKTGHLNPHILNQPLAPQTLLSLNQLLQQIKNLESLQQQHSMAQTQKPIDGYSSSLLALSVNITKTKTNIQNLQNQISVQQAAHLKSQLIQKPPHHQQVSGSTTSFHEHGISDILSNYGGENSLGQPTGHSDSHLPTNKSCLNLWKQQEEGSAFSKAPETSSSRHGKPNTNPFGLGFDDNPWTPSASTSGWPDTKQTSFGHSGGDSASIGIPDFEPEKSLSRPGMKNNGDNLNMTQSSLALAPPGMNAITKGTNAINSQLSNGDYSLGLYSSSWSFESSSLELNSTSSNAWNQPILSTTVSSNKLTPIGQDLWGKSTAEHTTSAIGKNDKGSNWPSSNDWNESSVQNGVEGNATSTLKQFCGGNSNGDGPKLDITSNNENIDKSTNLSPQSIGGLPSKKSSSSTSDI